MFSTNATIESLKKERKYKLYKTHFHVKYLAWIAMIWCTSKGTTIYGLLEGFHPCCHPDSESGTMLKFPFCNIVDHLCWSLSDTRFIIQLEQVLIVEKLQELRSIRIQKLKKQGLLFYASYSPLYLSLLWQLFYCLKCKSC